VVITERGGVHDRGRVGVEDSTARVRQTSSLFTVVRDGGEGRLVVATEVPYPQVAVLTDYATARGYLAAGIQFHTVGTSLTVRPAVRPDGLIRVRVTPHITYTTATGGGEVEFVEAATELVVRSGVPAAIGGSAQTLHAVTRQILGARASQTGSEVSLTLVATLQ
jgi:type II secretory pathway component GspD/PulD (secretin)